MHRFSDGLVRPFDVQGADTATKPAGRSTVAAPIPSERPGPQPAPPHADRPSPSPRRARPLAVVRSYLMRRQPWPPPPLETSAFYRPPRRLTSIDLTVGQPYCRPPSPPAGGRLGTRIMQEKSTQFVSLGRLLTDLHG